MADNGRQLNEEQRTALHKLTVMGDRGRASIFVGRKAELGLIRDRLDLLVERQNEVAPGIDLTTVIQGAPGAGKSALLGKIAEDWSSGGKGQAVAVSLDPGALKLPISDFLKAVVSRVGQVPGFAQILGKYIRSISVGMAGMASVEIKAESPESSGKPPVPVILLFDEIQTVLAGNIRDQAREHLTDNLRLLHNGQHGAPMFPVYGGLANSSDLLQDAGLTRLATGSELMLSAFSDDEMDELITRFVEQHLSSARPQASTLERWGAALRRDSQGWPMHCRNFLIALCEEIRAKDWRPQAVNPDTVRTYAQQLRFTYYTQRMQGALRNRYVLVSKVLEEMRRIPPIPDDRIIDLIAGAHRNRTPNDLGRSSLPDGMTAGQVFDAMLHAGIVQKTGRDKFACPIPSLAGYIAARATVPPSPLHEAVLDNEPDYLDDALDLCRGGGEQGRLLQATDMRGRTPLILAVELGMASLVEHLARAEGRLPAALRTMRHADNTGQTARDHAVASGDERLVTLLDRVRPPEPDNKS